ncbi:unnamed protein product [Cunninghamella echinulata]
MKGLSAIQQLHKPFGSELKSVTLLLYKSLLRSSNRFPSEEHQWFLKFMIRDQFQFHRYNYSKRSILTLLKEGDLALHQINSALDGNTAVMKYIDDLSMGKIGPLAHIIKKLKNTPNLLKRALEATDIRSQKSRNRNKNPTDRVTLPTYLHATVKLNNNQHPIPTNEQERNQLIRLLERQKKDQRRQKLEKQHEKLKKYKYFHLRKAVKASSGYYLIRIKGIPLPSQVGVRMKKRMQNHQKAVDLFKKMHMDKSDLLGEKLFLDQLKIKNDIPDYLTHINATIEKNRLQNILPVGKE